MSMHMGQLLLHKRYATPYIKYIINVIYFFFMFSHICKLYLTYYWIRMRYTAYNFLNLFLAFTNLWMNLGIISSANVNFFFDVNRISVLHIAKLFFCLVLSLSKMEWCTLRHLDSHKSKGVHSWWGNWIIRVLLRRHGNMCLFYSTILNE